MSVWGKIVGGAAGLMIGGPIGALLGAAAGHAYDALADDEPRDDGAPVAGADGIDAVAERDRPAATQHIAFTIGVIALAAKMAKVDGVVTRREIDAFRSFFHVPPEEVDNVGRFFDLAKRDSSGFEAYARQVAGLFPKHPEVLEEVLAGLFLIANADEGHVDEAKLGYLRAVSSIFGLGEASFRRVAATAGVELHDDPYAILDVMPDAHDDDIRQAYRRLARAHHPDRMIARGLPPEAIVLANRKLAAINAAYDRIRKERKIGRPEAQPVA
ncbi:TerB family tellurite resistance protein [Reyranella sp. CPCC 100927]|uniref:TerB family tellurite resistance protein n=1 Tax=Reyranella sp. CPCC 100927 TaxID=2599616 RepID=UPI0011B504D3|nr:TerB family tellurite resistance protein [Reyranella sp. CPCC 100927]TWT06068.1 molecular chaperone DjiA [Reyranella sp. CPCC 100927]